MLGANNRGKVGQRSWGVSCMRLPLYTEVREGLSGRVTFDFGPWTDNRRQERVSEEWPSCRKGQLLKKPWGRSPIGLPKSLNLFLSCKPSQTKTVRFTRTIPFSSLLPFHTHYYHPNFRFHHFLLWQLHQSSLPSASPSHHPILHSATICSYRVN